MAISASKKLLAAGLMMGLVFAASSAAAQQQTTGERKTLLDRIDEVGRTIFGELLPFEKSKSSPSADAGRSRPQTKTNIPRPSSSAAPVDEEETNVSEARAGSILGSQKPAATKTPVRTSAGTKKAAVADTPKQLEAIEAPVSKAAPKAEKKYAQQYDLDAGDTLPGPLEIAAPEKPKKRPLHQRLARYTQSAFGTEDLPSLSSPKESGTKDVPPPEEEILPPADLTSPEAYAGGRPLLAERKTPPLPPRMTENIEKPLAPGSAQETEAAPIPPQQSAPQSSTGDVLIARKGPLLSVETIGPKTITVGKEATYEVHILNSGEEAAEELMLYIFLPAWAEVVGAEAGQGTAEAVNLAEPSGKTIRWNVGTLAAKSRERLVLRIVPAQNRPFDLAVRWQYQPTASQAQIEVQAPKLFLQLDGPREVHYGRKEVYKLKLANTGNGPAENVSLTLLPVGTGENVPATHEVGLLPAGEEKILEVELVARQTGTLLIRVEAHGDGRLQAALAEKILVRRAELNVELKGPKMQFVGAPANYVVHLRNSGNAPAQNIRLVLSLPPGTKCNTASDDVKTEAETGKLEWRLESLAPQGEREFVFQCAQSAPGVFRPRLTVTADDDLSTATDLTVRVEAVADLTMSVVDPPGPVPVGEEATYEIRVRNRGAKEAQAVEVFAYFSRGIEPTAAEGAAHRLAPGQVVFQPLSSLAPGAEIVLKVRAKAEAAGQHIFRAEVHCKPLGTRLVSEAANLFYGDPVNGDQTAGNPASAVR